MSDILKGFDKNFYKEQGYFIQKFEYIKALTDIKEVCEAIAKEYFGECFTTLDNYHQIKVSAAQHDAFQYAIFQRLNQLQFHHTFVKDNIDFFTLLFGEDIDVQANLYIRIARPHSELDNIGLHRDTDYGNSAYEMSVSLPLIDQVEGCGLNILPASHLKTEHEVEHFERQDVEKGTPKNEMGFLYAPKKIIGLDESHLTCISLPFGSGLGFTLGLVHGQKVNTTNMTRWSIDFRVKNSFHPVSRNLKLGYYTRLNTSAITEIAQQYYKNNLVEAHALTKLK